MTDKPTDLLIELAEAYDHLNVMKAAIAEAGDAQRENCEKRDQSDEWESASWGPVCHFGKDDQDYWPGTPPPPCKWCLEHFKPVLDQRLAAGRWLAAVRGKLLREGRKLREVRR